MRIVLITLCLYLCCLISCKIFLTLPSLIDREPNVKMLIFFANSENRKKKKKNSRMGLISLPVDFSQGFNFANLAKIHENRENLSRKLVSL